MSSFVRRELARAEALNNALDDKASIGAVAALEARVTAIEEDMVPAMVIVDNLETNDPTRALSAAQGMALRALIHGLGDVKVVADLAAAGALDDLSKDDVVHVLNNGSGKWARYQITAEGDGTWAGASKVLLWTQDQAPASHRHAIADVTGLQTALNAKAPLASPAFTGTPTAPTQSSGDNSTKIATTAYADSAASSAATSAVANRLRRDQEDQTVTGGAAITSKNLGTISSGTLTLDMGDRGLQHYTNNGNHVLAPGSVTGASIIDIINGSTPGTIDLSGWTMAWGAAWLTTTASHKFRAVCVVGANGSSIHVFPMQ